MGVSHTQSGMKRHASPRTPRDRSPDLFARRVPRQEAVWLDGPVPAGYWDYQTNRRRYLRWLGQRLGYHKPEDWYRLTTADLKENRGSALLLYQWKSSAIAGLKECFSDYDWNEWLFTCAPRSFWNDAANRRRYMDWLGKQIGIHKPEDWYQVTNRDFAEHKGGAFLLHYHSTVSAAVMDYRPDFDWQEWRFGKTPKGFWKARRNRVRYMRWLGEQLGFKHADDWYRLTRQDIESHYGNQLVKFYGGSPQSAVKDCFPRHHWNEWMFARVPLGFWKQRANRKRYVAWLGQRLGFKKRTDWKRARAADFRKNYGGGLLVSCSSYRSLIQECVPGVR